MLEINSVTQIQLLSTLLETISHPLGAPFLLPPRMNFFLSLDALGRQYVKVAPGLLLLLLLLRAHLLFSWAGHPKWKGGREGLTRLSMHCFPRAKRRLQWKRFFLFGVGFVLRKCESEGTFLAYLPMVTKIDFCHIYKLPE